MKTYKFSNKDDWYTAQRMLGALNIGYNSLPRNDGLYWIIEVLA